MTETAAAIPWHVAANDETSNDERETLHIELGGQKIPKKLHSSSNECLSVRFRHWVCRYSLLALPTGGRPVRLGRSEYVGYAWNRDGIETVGLKLDRRLPVQPHISLRRIGKGGVQSFFPADLLSAVDSHLAQDGG